MFQQQVESYKMLSPESASLLAHTLPFVEIVVGKILEDKSETFGFDAQTEEYVDMVAKGIIDPAKVVRAALQDASSVAALLVTTEAMVAELPKEPAPAAAGGHGHGGGMGF